MKVSNLSPFASFIFECLDKDDRPLNCVVCRGTFRVDGDRQLEIAPLQEPVVLADRYFGDPLGSSVELESDLVPRRPVTNITINATARAPGGRPTPSWQVSFRVGVLHKALRVYGERVWRRSSTGWVLSEAEPTTSVPIRYELAYGGRQLVGASEVAFEENPVGRGFLVSESEAPDELAAPQIEDPDDPICGIGETYRPAGVGPVAKHWRPRRQLCGTADESWRASRWPLRPADFDFRYYNCASAGLRYPGFLEGDERVIVSGCLDEGDISFVLPSARLALFATDRTGNLTVGRMVLDTLHIDMERILVFHTWRFSYPVQAPVESILIAYRRVEPVGLVGQSEASASGPSRSIQ